MSFFWTLGWIFEIYYTTFKNGGMPLVIACEVAVKTAT